MLKKCVNKFLSLSPFWLSAHIKAAFCTTENKAFRKQHPKAIIMRKDIAVVAWIGLNG
jgi:hypothetical protein